MARAGSEYGPGSSLNPGSRLNKPSPKHKTLIPPMPTERPNIGYQWKLFGTVWKQVPIEEPPGTITPAPIPDPNASINPNPGGAGSREANRIQRAKELYMSGGGGWTVQPDGSYVQTSYIDDQGVVHNMDGTRASGQPVRYGSDATGSYEITASGKRYISGPRVTDYNSGTRDAQGVNTYRTYNEPLPGGSTQSGGQRPAARPFSFNPTYTAPPAPKTEAPYEGNVPAPRQNAYRPYIPTRRWSWRRPK